VPPVSHIFPMNAKFSSCYSVMFSSVLSVTFKLDIVERFHIDHTHFTHTAVDSKHIVATGAKTRCKKGGF